MIFILKKNILFLIIFYFLTYLHLYDANNFTRIEGIVWDKLINKDYLWFPISSDSNDDDDNNEEEE